MAIPNFIHLRARSAYSLLESSLHIDQIKDLCIENGMPAIGISDNNLFGACLLYTSPSPRDRTRSRMPSSA